MNERSFSIGGRDFQLSRIDAFKQFHIVRRLGPILSELAPKLGEFSKASKLDENSPESDKLDIIAKFVGPFVDGISKLSDEDADKILFGLLSSVEVKQTIGGISSWSRISNGSSLMMQDLDLPILLQAAGRALLFNLSGFFAALPQK